MSVRESWQDLVREGRLSEALSARLGAPEPDEPQAAEEARRLLEGLTELRAQLRAKQWARAKRTAEGLRTLDATVDLLPRLSDEVAQLGRSGALLERGHVDEALALLASVQLPLLLAEAETQRGTAQIFLGDVGAAEDAFKRAVHYDSRHYRAITNLGNVALEQGRVDEAITRYEEALKLDETFSNAHHNLGVAYRRKGQVNRSVASIRRAQRVSRQQERDEARGVLKSFGSGRRGPYLKWLLYALAAAGVFLLLRAQGAL